MGIRQAVNGGLILCLAGALSGCAWFESLLPSLDGGDPATAEANAMQTEMKAPAPHFRVGDSFRYRVSGGTLVTETVDKIDSNGVWWHDSLGRHWIGSDPALMPVRPVIDNGGKMQITDVAIEATGNLFPLEPGKTVAYRSTMPKGSYFAAEPRKQSCTVGAYGPADTPAGSFDTYKLNCDYDGVARDSYYAPALGRVVLQKEGSLMGSFRRELVSFKRGPADTPRIAEAKPVAKHDKPMAKHAKPMAKAGGDGGMAPASYKAPAKEGRDFGVQLAAYRSPELAKRAWMRLRQRGGGLLDGIKPTYERHEAGGHMLFRVVVGNYPTKAKARAYCRALKRNGIDCWARERLAALAAGPRVAAAVPATAPRPLRR